MIGNFLRNASLVEKFLIPNIFVIIIFFISVGTLSYILLKQQLKKQAEDILNNSYKLFQEQVKVKERIGLAISYLISKDPDVKRAFSLKSRSPLRKYVKIRSDLELLTDIYDPRLQFLTPLAVSFFKTWNPEEFGIDVSKFRRIIVTVAQRQAPQKGIEVGLKRVIVSGAFPVIDGKKYLGTVEFMTPFDPLMDKLKELTGVESTVLIKGASGGYSDWAKEAEKVGDYLIYYETNPILRNIMLKALEKPGSVFIEQNFAVVAKPVFDFSRKNIGLLLLGYDLTPIVDSFKQLGIYVLMFIFIFVVATFFMSYMIFKKYVEEPINTLIEHTERISMGDVDQKIPLKSKDEIGRLAEAFDRMRISIKKVMDLLK